MIIEKNVQLEIFDDKMLSVKNRSAYKIIGQVFDTYWIVTFEDKMFLIDQHATHEKVNYERIMKRYANHEPDAQILSQPILVTLTAAEEALLLEYQEHFNSLGFELEPFGAHTYAIRAVPVDLYGHGEKELFLSIIDDLAEEHVRGDFSLIVEKIASMACKASVKGNTAMNHAEIEALIDELLTLENPYNCPHGRPTIISMSKYELDKKFKRIVS